MRVVISAADAVTCSTALIIDGPRGSGVVVGLILGSAGVKAELGWELHCSTMERMIADAWRSHDGNGYGV